MFRPGELVLYTPFHQSRGIPRPHELALITNIDSRGRAVIKIRRGTEFQGRSKRVNLTQLRRIDERV